MRIRVINDTQELRAIKEQILELFFRAYSRELHDALWDWAYILNPTGEPIVAIAEEDSEVVGHYAIIPMPLAISRQL